jgi:hypothetical protein
MRRHSLVLYESGTVAVASHYETKSTGSRNHFAEEGNEPETGAVYPLKGPQWRQWSLHCICNEGVFMRARSALTLVAVLLVGVAAKLAFFGPQPAEAVPSSASLDIQKMQQSIKNLPEQKFQDMTFVFSGD